MENWENLVNRKKPLSAGEINDSLSNVYNFIGVIDMTYLDKLRINELPISFVLHYNNHWIAIYNSIDSLEIMDSTHSAFESPSPEFVHFLCLNKQKTIQFNPLLQSNSTNVCGLYCLYFIKEKSKNIIYNDILKKFTTSTLLNDFIISNSKLTKLKID